jgi:C4-dicarboxylate transporter DctM subunit
MDPIHFGVGMIVTLSIGFITPPLGVNLFVGSSISGINVPTLIKAVIPFFFVMLAALTVIAVFPKLTLLFL